MQKLTTGFKQTLLSGFLVLLPILLLVLLLSEMLNLVVGLATPIAALLPEGLLDEKKLSALLATVLLLGVSLILGLAMKSTMAKRAGHFLEKQTIGRLTVYRFVQTVSKGLIDAKATDSFTPALLLSTDGHRQFAYIVEDHGNGLLTVLVPFAPTAFSGLVKIVAANRTEPLPAKLADVSLVLNHLGLGAKNILSSLDQQDNRLTKEKVN